MPQQSPPVQGAVYGVVLNDRASLARLGAAMGEAPYKGEPKAPVLYIKPANTLVGEGAEVRLPAGADRVEIGATVGIVIGAPAARLDAATALQAVAGYVLVADLSLPHDSYYRPAIREKCFDGACPMAAAIVPAAPARPAGLAGLAPAELYATTLNIFVDEVPAGERTLADLVRDVPRLLADVTEFMTLRVGDVLLLGVQYQAPQAGAGTRVRIEGGRLGSLSFAIAPSPAREERP